MNESGIFSWLWRTGLAFCAIGAVEARAAVVFEAQINDPGGLNAAYYDDVERVLEAAGQTWGSYMQGNATIEVQVVFQSDGGALMFAGAMMAVPYGQHNGYQVYDWGPTYEIRTGKDPNGSTADGLVSVSPTYIDIMWFDPSPPSDSPEIPSNKYDAYSIFLHELAHVIAFNGWLQYADPSVLPPGHPAPSEPPTPILRPRHLRVYPAGTDPEARSILLSNKAWVPMENYMSVFDTFVTSGAGNAPVFSGPLAKQLHTGGVALDPNSYVHVNTPGSLMYTYATPGVREEITDVLLRMMADCGLPITSLGADCSSDADTDGDGIKDCADPCPLSVHHVDGDNDGTLDCELPPCEDTTDTDSDGYLDCVDGCPNNPAMHVPGNCGCELCPDQEDEQVLGSQPGVPTGGGAMCGAAVASELMLAAAVMLLLKQPRRRRYRGI